MPRTRTREQALAARREALVARSAQQRRALGEAAMALRMAVAPAALVDRSVEAMRRRPLRWLVAGVGAALVARWLGSRRGLGAVLLAWRGWRLLAR